MSTIEVESLQPEIVSKLVIESAPATLDTDATSVVVNQVIKELSDEANAKTVAEVPADCTVDTSNKQKKKLTKLADSVLKKVSATTKLATLEDKYYAMIQSYMDLQEQNKRLQLAGKDTEKTMTNMTKHRDLIQADYNKALFAKDKLESLCRELQKHNKAIKEDNLQRIKEEEEKRKDITTKFQLAIDDINQQVASNSEKNNLLMNENTSLTGKLKNLIEQYEVREKHIEKVLKHKDLEIELANAKLQQSELKLTEAQERSKAEKSIYESHILELNKKCEFHIDTEKQLKAQLSMYTEKYEEFQSTLKKSNQVFESFKTEMDKMTKKIKKLEQETNSWKVKWETSDKTLAAVIKQKDETDEKARKAQAKADIMESLSRQLQTERNELKEKLKRYEPPVVSVPPAVTNVAASEGVTNTETTAPPVTTESVVVTEVKTEPIVETSTLVESTEAGVIASATIPATTETAEAQVTQQTPTVE